MVKRMCGEAGMEGNKTNHSLRATGATTLFRASVPEKLIQQRTGHRSVEALRQYEHTTTSQHEKVSKVLASVDVNAGTLPSVSKPVQQPSAPLAPYQPGFNFQGCTVNITLGQPSYFAPSMSSALPPVPPNTPEVEFQMKESEYVEFLSDF